MLRIHAGWPRTSTSSLQAALVARRRELAAAGVVYPEEWSSAGNDTHDRFTELLEPGAEAAVGRFCDRLAERGDETVLISCEALTYHLVPDRRDALLALLAGARAATPVAAAWTLRRLDDVMRSMRLRQVQLKGELLDLPVFLAPGWVEGLFAGMQLVDEALDGRVDYVGYDPAGSHNDALLRALGLPEAAAEAVRRQLREAPRRNVSMGEKAVAAMVHRDVLAARAGVELPLAALRDHVGSGEFRFDDDRPCEVVGADVRRAVHRRALAAARDRGFAPYLDLFAHGRVEDSQPARLEPDIVTDDDLAQLVDHLRGGRGHKRSR